MYVHELPLHDQIKNLLNGLGYQTLYPPQEDAIKKGVLEGKNMLIATPTASGKTFIAMICAAKAILEGKRVIYLTPLRALASEKYEEFKPLTNLVKSDGTRPTIAISTGDFDQRSDFLKNKDLLVLTNEKFDSMLRLDPSWIEKIGLVVFDEIHLLNEGDRGPVVEMLVSRFLSSTSKVQIIALSATVSNYYDVSSWLKAEVVNSKWRPVKLIEGCYSSGQIIFFNGQKIPTFQSNYGPAIDCAFSMLKQGGQVLIFTENRRNSVSLAEKATIITPNFLSSEESQRLQLIYEKIISSDEFTEVGKKLANCVIKGSAFHHAGLPPSHRRLIEDSFKEGLIKILCATPTLAAGVNLPARTVIINSLSRFNSRWGQSEEISILDYKQFCGRAGRPKYDDIGFVISILRSEGPDSFFERYVKGSPEPLYSKLIDNQILRNHILAMIVSFPAITEKELNNFFSNTFLGFQRRPQFVYSKIKSNLAYLKINGLIEEEYGRFIATEFGKNISFLYISTSTGIHYKTMIDYYRAQKVKLLDDEDFVLLSVVLTDDFQPQFPLRKVDIEACNEIVNYHIESSHKPHLGMITIETKFNDVGRSFLALKDWINEKSENEIYEKYSIEPGDLYRQVEAAEWLAHAFSRIALLFGEKNLQTVSSSLEERIKYGVKRELLELTQLVGVGRVRARLLYSNQLRTLDDIRKAKESDIAKISKFGPSIAKKIKEQVSSSHASP
ncbi:MAG: DEAD/DEAH box helicase [Nitrososphaeria archaeon]